VSRIHGDTEQSFIDISDKWWLYHDLATYAEEMVIEVGCFE